MKTNELTGAALDWAVQQCESTNWGYFSPSTNWAHGGPIIERENLEIVPLCPGTWRVISMGREWFNGPTPLIAAMRCYVASKLGDDVSIPDQFTN